MLFDDNLLPWIGKTGKILGSAMNKIMKENNINLTTEQFIVLKTLSNNSGNAQQELAFITESNKTTLSRLISNMEKNNLIIRRSIKEDKRIKNVYLTDYGKEILNTTIPIITQIIEKFQKGISEQEIEQAINTIKKVQNNILKEQATKL